MPRQIALILPVCLALLLVGCGGGDSEDASTEAGTPSASADNKRGDRPDKTEPPDPRAGWIKYSHPPGATLQHPPGWTTQESQMGVMLLPEGVDPQRLTSEVFIVVWGVPDAINNPMSPQSAQLLGQALRGVLPGFQQTGEPRALETGHGPGAVYTYRGAAPDSNWDKAEVRYTAAQGVGLGITAVGSAAKIERYADDLERIFTSLAMTPGQTAGNTGNTGTGTTDADTDDPRLIGAWSTEAYAGGDGIHINTQLVYALNADGSFLSGARSFMNASQRDSNGNLKWTAGQDTDASVQRGRWSAKGGYLTVVIDGGGRSVFAYGFEPDGTLAMRDPTTRKLINIYSRVR